MAVHHYTRLEPYEDDRGDEDYEDYNEDYYEDYNYEDYYEDYNYEDYNYEYKKSLQHLHSTLASTLTFLTHLLNSFSDDIQNLTYVSEQTMNQLWTAKVSSFRAAIQDRTGGGCPLIRTVRAFLRLDHNPDYNPRTNTNDRKQTADYLAILQTDLIKAVSTPWPPNGTVSGPESVVYADLSRDNLYDRLVIALDCFPVSMEYKQMKEVVVQLELLQIVMDRTMFLWSWSG